MGGTTKAVITDNPNLYTGLKTVPSGGLTGDTVFNPQDIISQGNQIPQPISGIDYSIPDSTATPEKTNGILGDAFDLIGMATAGIPTREALKNAYSTITNPIENFKQREANGGILKNIDWTPQPYNRERTLSYVNRPDVQERLMNISAMGIMDAPRKIPKLLPKMEKYPKTGTYYSKYMLNDNEITTRIGNHPAAIKGDKFGRGEVVTGYKNVGTQQSPIYQLIDDDKIDLWANRGSGVKKSELEKIANKELVKKIQEQTLENAPREVVYNSPYMKNKIEINKQQVLEKEFKRKLEEQQWLQKYGRKAKGILNNF